MREKIILINLIFIMNLLVPLYAGVLDDDIDWVKKYYIEDGEPDYADGDLEDKLGDSGYYADLFPEDLEDDLDYDEIDNYSNKKSGKPIELTKDFINNMKNMDTRICRFEFPDGTTGYGTRSEYERIMREKYTYGAIKIGDNTYYKKADGTFKTGWHEENGKWFYFDLYTSALVKNELREIDGKVYYFKSTGRMA